MPEINLISAEQKRLSQTRGVVWAASVVAAAALIISSIAAAAVYSLRLVKTKQIGRQETLVAGLQQKLLELSRVEQRQALIHDRLDRSQQLIASRPELKVRLDRLVETFPAAVTLEGLKVDGSGRASEISIQSVTFAGFFDTLKILQGGGFSAVNFDGLSRDKEGIYRAKILISL